MLNVVDTNFTTPRIEDTPAKCREKTARTHYYYYYYYYSKGKYWATVRPKLSGPHWDQDILSSYLTDNVL